MTTPQKLNQNTRTSSLQIIMLKKTRVALAIVSILALTTLFTDFTGDAHKYFGWMARIQFIPALLSASVLILAGIVIATLLFGRIYCSVVCPAGIMQDIIIRIHKLLGLTKKHGLTFHYKKAATICRIIILVLFAALLVLGITNIACASLAGLIEPYSAYGRIANAFALPIWDFINDLIAINSSGYTYYTVYRASSMLTAGIAGATLMALVCFSWFAGRDYCNKVCPVGTLLGFISRYSLLKPTIDTSKCNNCGRCERKCKSSCINAEAHTIDYSRCVACFNCVDSCPNNALRYKPAFRRSVTAVAKEKETDAETADISRRNFLTSAGIIAGALAVKAAAASGKDKLLPVRATRLSTRETPVVPAGAHSLSNFRARCTACQLCVSSCPNNVLRPSSELDSFMQPEMNFDKGYCRPDCNICSHVCPSGAICPISLEEKCSTQIGRATVDTSTCLSAAEGVKCDSCERHCPAQAIIMVETAENGNLRPVVDESRCIGCGSCEYHCPVGRTGSAKGPAIYVEGIEVHHTV